MDKNEEKEREVKEPEEVFNEIVLPVAQEYSEVIKNLLTKVDESHANMVSAIDEDAKSFLSNRRMLSYVRLLVVISHDIAKTSFITYFSADYIRRKLDLLEQAFLIMQKQLKDFPASEDVKKLREMSVRMTELDSLMAKLKKLEDQAEMEKADAFRKLDKARQQVLKDDVV